MFSEWYVIQVCEKCETQYKPKLDFDSQNIRNCCHNCGHFTEDNNGVQFPTKSRAVRKQYTFWPFFYKLEFHE